MNSTICEDSSVNLTEEALAPHRQVEPPCGPGGVDFRRLLETLPAAAYSTDAEGLITYFNRRAAQVWGREPKRNDPLDRY